MGHVLSAPIKSKHIERHSSMDLRVGSAEMQGYRLNMEDAISIQLGLSERHPRHCLVGVFDGHAGTEASKFIKRTLATRVAALSDPTNAEQLTQCVIALDNEFISTSDSETREHGSTCVFSVFWPNHDEKETDEKKRSWNIVVSNVGDSRAMIIRKDGTCVSLTRDHKPQDPQEELRIQMAGGGVSANRVDGQLAMSRAIGDYQYKANPNLSVREQKVIPVPDITTEVAYQGDRLFICCDGIVEQMENEDASALIHQQLSEISDPNDIDPATIVPDVFELSLEKGSRDNMSGALVCFGPRGFHEGYSHESKYIPGPFSDFAHDETFVNAYKEDALSHGVAENEWLKLAQAVPCTGVRGGAQGGMSGFGQAGLNPPQMHALMYSIFQQVQAEKGQSGN